MPEQNEIATIDVGSHIAHVTRALGSINFDNLKGEFADAGGHAIWWGHLAAQAAGIAERWKTAQEVKRAEIASRLRREYTRLGQKFTVDSIHDDVALDEEYRATQESVAIAEENAATLKAVSVAVDRKQRMLDSLSGLLVHEINAGRDPLRDTVRSGLAQDRAAAARPTKRQPLTK